VEAETGGLCAGGSDCWGTSSGTGVLRSTAPARELVKIQGAATGRKRPPEGDLLNNGSRSGDRDCRAGTGLAKPDEAHRREADAQHRPSRRLGNAGTSIVLFVEPPSAAPEAQLFSEPFLVFRAGPPPPKPSVNTAGSYRLRRVEGRGAMGQFASRVPRCRSCPRTGPRPLIPDRLESEPADPPPRREAPGSARGRGRPRSRLASR
jgi:hypothetical protein